MLTDEQKTFAGLPQECFVAACPGAGKTRTIVARVKRIRAALPPRQGVAVLSFTHSAVDSFIRRCREEGEEAALRLPHFVGTFDRFVGHFMVLPSGIALSPKRPIVVDSWKSLNVEVRLRGAYSYWTGVSLDQFDAATNTIDPVRLGDAGLRAHVVAHRARYEQAAATRRKALHQAGYLSAEDARIEAHRCIQDANKGAALGRALRARFGEVIVDEAQDCNPVDLAILAWLRGNGLPVTVVCDPNQAIYGFRHGEPAALQAFGAPYPPAQRPALTGNFRSSGPITRLAATLRSRVEPDNPVGETAALVHPVLIATYEGAKAPATIGALFGQRLESPAIGLSRKDGIILAHQGADARRAAGDPLAEELSGQSRVEALARAVGEFWCDSADPRLRRAAGRTVERLLLELLGVWTESDHHSSRVIERAGLNARQLRRDALALLMRLPKTCADTAAARAGWVAAVKAETARLQLSLPAGTTIAKFFGGNPNPNWTRHLKLPGNACLLCSTIHDAKGREHESVCVVLRPDRAPDNRTTQWGHRAEEIATAGGPEDYQADAHQYLWIRRSPIPT
ncbi:MAG: ATP-dependent helicase [Verrucomicrobia bacterium]|nr:ATP-dependent helicase [Verrucomicrobiota bacterium]